MRFWGFKVLLAQTFPTPWTNLLALLFLWSLSSEWEHVWIHRKASWRSNDSSRHKVTPKVMLSPTGADLSGDIMPTDVLLANMCHSTG